MPDDWFINKGEDSLYLAFRTVYRYNFSSPAVIAVFARLPSKMMGDDQEIRDGWGLQGDEHDKE